MRKLIPQLGKTTQHWKTYYAQILMHHIFGIFNASKGPQTVYFADGTLFVDNDSDIVISFLADYRSAELPAFVHSVQIYLVSTPYFKPKLTVRWATEMVRTGRFQKVTLPIMVSGYAEFAPDMLLVESPPRLYKSCIFTTRDYVNMFFQQT